MLRHFTLPLRNCGPALLPCGPQHKHPMIYPSTSWPSRLLHSAQRMSSSSDLSCEDFFRYTGGRWLWDEEKQLQQRYKRFSVQELKTIAAKSAGARNCVSISKLAEGAFNKVFRLVMDDGKVVIARIPNPNAGPAFRTIASEVATMDFVRSLLALPLYPKCRCLLKF